LADEEATQLSSIGDVRDEAAYALADLSKEQVRATDGSPFAQYLAVEVRDGPVPLLELRFRFRQSAPCSKPSTLISMSPARGVKG
jgi:hypothetical protein